MEVEAAKKHVLERSKPISGECQWEIDLYGCLTGGQKKVWSIGRVKNGHRVGTWITYFSNGGFGDIFNFNEKGELDGVFEKHLPSSSNKIWMRGNWKNGKKHDRFQRFVYDSGSGGHEQRMVQSARFIQDQLVQGNWDGYLKYAIPRILWSEFGLCEF